MMEEQVKKSEIVRGPNGGARPGAGRKPKAKKLTELTKEAQKQVYDILEAEFWVKMAQDEAIPVLKANMATGIGDTALRAAIHVLDRTLGRPTERLDHTSKGEKITGINYIVPNGDNTPTNP